MVKSRASKILLVAVVLPGLSWADTGTAYVTGVAPSMLVVKSNGTSYTQLDAPSYVKIFARLEYDTGVAGRIKGWRIQPVITNGYGIASEIPGLGIYRQMHTYAIGHRPKFIHKNLMFPVMGSHFADRAVAMCNLKADYLRSQGKSDAWIFSQDRMVSFRVSVDYHVDANGAGSKKPILEGSGYTEIGVRCSRFMGPQVPVANTKLAVPTAVLKATMQVEEVVAPDGTCRIDTTTAISANKANAVIKYRFVHNSGKRSKVFVTKTQANKIAVVKHQWNLPDGPGPEQGWVRIEGVSPKFESNLGAYSMNCHGKGPIGVNGSNKAGIKRTLRQR